MTTVTSLRVVRAEGDAASRGRQVGLQLGDLIQRSLSFYRDHFADRGLDAAGLARALVPYRTAAERRLPEHVAWLDAAAAAAEVPAPELFAVNAYEELVPGGERCSTFVVTGEGSTLLGHNEMWLAGDAGNVAVVLERPSDGIPVASPTVACCLPAVGLNGRGTAQGIDSLAARDDRVGIPRVLVSRHALESVDRDEAVRRAALSGRAGGYAHVFALPGGDSFAVETTATRTALIARCPVHTNHYLDPELARLAIPPSPGSLERHDRLSALLDELEPSTPDRAMEVLRRESAARIDHDEDTVVVFSTVVDVNGRRMWVAPGDPSVTRYEEVDLDGVV